MCWDDLILYCIVIRGIMVRMAATGVDQTRDNVLFFSVVKCIIVKNAVDEIAGCDEH